MLTLCFAALMYEIKMSEYPLGLRDATFHSAISVNTSGLTPAVAGTKESYQFKSENITKEDSTTIYFAIRAIDDSNNTGEASNIARVVFLISPLPASAGTTESNSVIRFILITAIALCILGGIICVIIAIAYVVWKRKNSSFHLVVSKA